MNSDEISKVIARLTSGFPRPPMDAAECGVWFEHLEPKRYEPALAACRIAERTCKRRPPLADFLDLYAEAMHSTQGRAIKPPECAVCEDGWVPARCEVPCDCGDRFVQDDMRCPRGYHTNRRCPQGCMPMTHEEREAKWRIDDENVNRERQRQREAELDRRIDRPGSRAPEQERFAGVVDPSEPRDRSDA